MTFVQPWWLWLLPVALPLILLLHARRRRDVVVASLVVWRRLQAESAPTPSRRSFPWRDPLLWLQLVAAALLVLALARPVVGDGAASRWVVLVDASLPMSAADVEPSRFDAALRAVGERWGGPASSGRVSLVSVGPSARVVAADWPAGPGLRRSLAELRVSAGPADWQGAAARAASLAAEGARVAVVTDEYGREAALAALGSAGVPASEVRVLSVGGGLANVGVGDVKVEPRGERPDQWTVSGRVVTAGFARGDTVRVVASFRPPGTSSFLPWGAEEVAVGPDGTAEFAIPLDLPGPGEVRVSGPAGDHLPADDAVVVPLRSAPVRVAVVGEAHPALLRALAAVGGIEAYAAEAVPAPDEAALFDLVIVTDDVPGVPATSTLWLGAVPEGLRAGEPLALGEGALTARPHPLTADLDATAFSVGSAVPLRVPAGATPLLVAGDAVLAWARTTTTGRQVVLGFGLGDTDWPSQVGFPAFVAALVDWAAPRAWSHGPGGCRVGEACPWPREAFAGGWELLDPAGSPVPGTPAPEAVEGDPLAAAVWTGPQFDAGFVPEATGTYTLVTAGGPVTLPVVTSPLGGEPADASGGGPAAGASITGWEAWRWLALLAAAIIAAEGLLGLFRQRRVVRRRWRVPLALAGVALLASAAGVMGVPLPGLGPGGTVVWVGREAPPAAGAEWTWVGRRPLAPRGTTGPAADLTTALERALALPRGPRGLRVVVPADAGDALPVRDAGRLADAAAAGGVRVDVLATRPSSTGAPASPTGPALAAVALPERVRAGSRFSLLAEVSAPEGASWRATATLESPAGGGGAVAPTASAEASGTGPGTAELELEAGGQGDLVYRLELRPEGGGAAAATRVSVSVGPPPAVLLVAADESRGRALGAALEAQGLAVERVAPLRMPGTIERLDDYDAVLLVDVAANAIFPEYQALLERYVREVGGGLAIVGGTSSFGPGGYYATPLEELSPVSSRITDEAPEVAMAFVLDRSGSMSGAVAESNRMDVAKVATLEALALLGERSLAAVIVFDTEARVMLPLTPVGDAEAFRSALAAVTPAGGTAIYPGLLAAYQLMAASDSATRHVVVMTDGLSQGGDFAGVLRALTREGITTTFVGVGDAADQRQLTTLASLSGGTLHMARDFRALPSLLAQEALMLAAQPIEERTITPRWVEEGAPDFLEELTASELPTFEGYVRTTPKDEATVLAFADGDDPLLATWRYGLGRAAAFTSDADGRWSRAWTSSASYATTWAQLVRWIAERPVRDPWSLRLARRGDVLDVIVDVPAAAAGASATDLPLVTVSGAGGEALARRRLEWTGPARAAASFEVDASQEGELTVALGPAPGLGLEAGVARTVAWPIAPGPALRSDVVPVAGLAEATGGAVLASASEVDASGGRALAWLPLPAAWLLAALLAFLASLAVRFGVLPRLSAAVRVGAAARTRTAWPGP
ncbi:MAG TPA: VWA domain-containing protein [Trueperaceae bacterium]